MQIFSSEKVNIGALHGAPMSASDCPVFLCLLFCLGALNNLLLQDKVMPQEIQSFTKKELPWDRFKVRKKLHLNRYEVRKELPWDGTGSR